MPGLFTTLRVREGEAWLWDAHMERLRAGAARFGLASAAPGALLGDVAAAVQGLDDARVRITLRAGAPPLVEARAYPPPERPWDLRPVPRPPSPDEDTVRWKTTLRGAYDQARRDSGADDALLLDDRGWLETTVANIFLVDRDGRLLTPPATHPILPGIARALVLAEAGRAGLSCQETALGPAEAAEARECFVTNALFLLHPVAAVRGTAAFGPPDTARFLRERVVRATPRTRIIP